MTVLKKHFDPQGYENNLPPQYPYIDETPTDPPSGNYFTYRPTSEEGFSRPMSGQCKFFFAKCKNANSCNSFRKMQKMPTAAILFTKCINANSCK